MSKQEQILILNPPSEIKFIGPYTSVVTKSLDLYNPSNKRVAFKIKTTAPKRYCVRPNSGLLEPRDNLTLAIMLQPIDPDQPVEKNKHKFMVQTMIIGEENKESLDVLWKTVSSEKLMDSKLKCIFEDGGSLGIEPSLRSAGDQQQQKKNEDKLDKSFISTSSFPSNSKLFVQKISQQPQHHQLQNHQQTQHQHQQLQQPNKQQHSKLSQDKFDETPKVNEVQTFKGENSEIPLKGKIQVFDSSSFHSSQQYPSSPTNLFSSKLSSQYNSLSFQNKICIFIFLLTGIVIGKMFL